MRAVVYDRYGPREVLRVEEVPVPVPGATQVLVEVVATSVTSLIGRACVALRCTPLFGGPARRTLGSDVARARRSGWIGCHPVSSCDDVYGDNLGLMGGFAEYAMAPESALAHNPATLTFAEASTLPQAVLTLHTASLPTGGRRDRQ